MGTPGNLSDRESQVLDLASKGHTDESIANELKIRVASVRGYWLRIRSKLGASNRAQLVAQWVGNKRDQSDADLDARSSNAIRESNEQADSALARERAATDRVLGSMTQTQRDAIDSIRQAADFERDTRRQTESDERDRRREA